MAVSWPVSRFLQCFKLNTPLFDMRNNVRWSSIAKKASWIPWFCNVLPEYIIQQPMIGSGRVWYSLCPSENWTACWIIAKIHVWLAKTQMQHELCVCVIVCSSSSCVGLVILKKQERVDQIQHWLLFEPRMTVCEKKRVNKSFNLIYQMSWCH